MIFSSIGRKFRRDPGRWLAIALAVFMGMSLWSGCFSAGAGLLQGGVRYAEKQNLYDLAVTANCGFSQTELGEVTVWGETGFFLENVGEVMLVGKAELVGNALDAHLGGGQERLGNIDPLAQKELVGRDALVALEFAYEVGA